MASAADSYQTPKSTKPRVIEEEVIEETEDIPCMFKFISAITRIWALLTLIGLWYSTADLLEHADEYIYTQYYTLATAIIVSFFELSWYISKILCCSDDGGCCCALWRLVLWVDNWKRGILYIIVAIPETTKGTESVKALICGVAVMVLAVLYIMKSFKDSNCVKKKKPKTRSRRFIDDPEAELINNDQTQNEADERWESIRSSGAKNENQNHNAQSGIVDSDEYNTSNPFEISY